MGGLWKSFQFNYYKKKKNAAIHVFPPPFCVHIQEFLSSRYLEMELLGLRPTGLSSIDWFSGHLNLFLLPSALGKKSYNNTSLPTHYLFS